MKNVGNKLRRIFFTSFRMHLSARLLSIFMSRCRITISVHGLFLSPKQYKTSTAIKLGYDLNRLANAKLGIAIKEGNDGGKKGR